MIYTVTVNPSLDKYFIIDHLRSDCINKGSIENIDAGGKGINVSRFLSVFGINSVIITFVGGYVGQVVIEKLKSSGFSVFEFKSSGLTRENITLFNKEDKEIYKLNEYGPSIRPSEIDHFLLKVENLAHKEDIWVLSGSLPPGVDNSFYAELIKVLHQKGAKVLLDTSGPALLRAINEIPDYLHLNSDEISDIYGKEISDQASQLIAINDIREKYCSKGLLWSLGQDGALLAYEDEIYQIFAPSVKVISTTGAGDAMVSAFLFALQSSYSAEMIGKWSVAAGSTKVKVSGTAVFQYKDVEESVEYIKINKLK